MRAGEDLRLLGALLVIVGLGLGAIAPGSFVSLAGLLLGLPALLFLLRGRPPHLLPWAATALTAVALQGFGPLPGLILCGGTGLLLWANRAHLLPARLPRSRRLLLIGLVLVLAGLLLPWESTQGSFVGGFIHHMEPFTGQPVSLYDPLAAWVPAARSPGRQLLGSLLPLLAWGALLQLAWGRLTGLRRLGPPLWLALLAWWLLWRSILPGGLLYLTGVGLAGLAVVRVLGARPRAPAAPGPGPRPGRPGPPARRGGAPG